MSSKHLGIGFVGGGFITRFHIQSLISVRNVDVVGVMSKTKQSAEESASLARSIGVGSNARAYDSITEMIADPEIEALWICSPNFARIEAFDEIANAISSGKALNKLTMQARLVKLLPLIEHVVRIYLISNQFYQQRHI